MFSCFKKSNKPPFLQTLEGPHNKEVQKVIQEALTEHSVGEEKALKLKTQNLEMLKSVLSWFKGMGVQKGQPEMLIRQINKQTLKKIVAQHQAPVVEASGLLAKREGPQKLTIKV